MARSSSLISYRGGPSSLSVEDPTGVRSALVLGGLVTAIGLLAYAWIKSSVPATAPATSTTGGVQPVPAPAPAQPVPYDPTQPGY